MITVVGTGQLGSELLLACERLGMAAVGLSHDEIELTEPDIGDLQFIIPSKVTTIINTAACHDLNSCENDPWLAWRTNAFGSSSLAWYCRMRKIKYVYVSTDYVHAVETDDSGLPLSVYAKTKLAGELAALSVCPDALVARVGTMYGTSGCRAKGGGNLIDTIVVNVKAQQPFTLPSYTSVPTTYAKNAALRILRSLDKSGVWYATDGCTTFSHYDIGCRIAEHLGLPNTIQAVSFDPNDKLRPHTITIPKGRWLAFSIMDIGPVPPTDPIRDYLIEKGHINA